MLENEIKALKDEVVALRGVVSDLIGAINKAPTTTIENKEKATGKKADEKETPKNDGVTIEDLQEICTKIVRSDRSKRDAVKEVIGRYDGATNLTKVNVSDFASLAKDLEDLL